MNTKDQTYTIQKIAWIEINQYFTNVNCYFGIMKKFLETICRVFPFLTYTSGWKSCGQPF